MSSNTDNMTPEGKDLFSKAEEIIETVQLLVDIIPDENIYLISVGDEMINKAYQLQTKVSEAEKAEFYDKKMEAACLIRMSANILLEQKDNLKRLHFAHIDYFNIIQNLIDEYRQIFIRWIDKFDKWNFIIDPWGLFNPPGVSPNN